MFVMRHRHCHFGNDVMIQAQNVLRSPFPSLPQLARISLSHSLTLPPKPPPVLHVRLSDLLASSLWLNAAPSSSPTPDSASSSETHHTFHSLPRGVLLVYKRHSAIRPHGIHPSVKDRHLRATFPIQLNYTPEISRHDLSGIYT